MQRAVAERCLIEALASRRDLGAVLPEVLGLLLEVELWHTVLAALVLVFHREGMRGGRGQRAGGRGKRQENMRQTKSHRPLPLAWPKRPSSTTLVRFPALPVNAGGGWIAEIG